MTNVRFSYVLLVAVLLLPASQASSVSYLAFCLTGLVLLFGTALLLHERKVATFRMIVAGESIVAYGIASLTFGVVGMLWRFVSIDWTKRQEVEWSLAIPVATPFLEGLAIAALAPLLAVLLRNFESETDPVAAAPATPTLNPAAFAAAHDQITKLAAAVKVLTEAATDAAAMAPVQADAIRLALNGMTDVVKKVETELSSFKARVGDSGATLSSLNDKAAGTASAMAKLTTAADGSSKMLDSLSKLIADVRNFLRPATMAPTH